MLSNIEMLKRQYIFKGKYSPKTEETYKKMKDHIRDMIIKSKFKPNLP